MKYLSMLMLLALCACGGSKEDFLKFCHDEELCSCAYDYLKVSLDPEERKAVFAKMKEMSETLAADQIDAMILNGDVISPEISTKVANAFYTCKGLIAE